MAKLIMHSKKTDAQIEITEDDEGYGGTCSSHAHPGHATPEAFGIHHHRFEDAIEQAEIHMDIWHDRSDQWI